MQRRHSTHVQPIAHVHESRGLIEKTGVDAAKRVWRRRGGRTLAQEEGRGWIQLDGYTVIAPHGSDVLADDDVIVRGETFAVEGVPGDFRNRKGKGKALMITLSGVR